MEQGHGKVVSLSTGARGGQSGEQVVLVLSQAEEPMELRMTSCFAWAVVIAKNSRTGLSLNREILFSSFDKAGLQVSHTASPLVENSS